MQNNTNNDYFKYVIFFLIIFLAILVFYNGYILLISRIFNLYLNLKQQCLENGSSPQPSHLYAVYMCLNMHKCDVIQQVLNLYCVNYIPLTRLVSLCCCIESLIFNHFIAFLCKINIYQGFIVALGEFAMVQKRCILIGQFLLTIFFSLLFVTHRLNVFISLKLRSLPPKTFFSLPCLVTVYQKNILFFEIRFPSLQLDGIFVSSLETCRLQVTSVILFQ